jgi:hypothetical protein
MKGDGMKTKRFLSLLCAYALLAAPALAATSGTIQLVPSVTETTTTDLGAATWTYPAAGSTSWNNTFTSGTGLNQANKVYAKSVTLAGSAASTIDLDSTLTGPSGTSVSFTRIYSILIRRTDTPAASTQDENLKIGGDWILTKYLLPGADTLAAVTIPLPPGGIFYILAPNSTGIAITATTGDELTITNASSADSCTYQILILGS